LQCPGAVKVYRLYKPPSGSAAGHLAVILSFTINGIEIVDFIEKDKLKLFKNLN